MSAGERPLLLFDFGCILIGLDKKRCVDALYKIGCGAIAGYVDEHRSEDLFHEIELGGSTERFCNEARRQSSFTDETGAFHQCKATDKEIEWAWNELLTGIDVEKLRLIKHLHDDLGYKTAILSNTNEMHWRKSVEDFFGVDGYTVDDYFDHVFLSCNLGMVKPDRRIYEHVIQVMDTKAEDIVFFDDSARNCEGASQCGINAIHDPEGNAWMDILREECDHSLRHSIPDSQLEGCRAAIIGNFDGVHCGHQYVIERLKTIAANHSMKPLVITFDKHPREIFDPSFKPMFLTTLPEKLDLLNKEVDGVKVIKFDKEFAKIKARDFLEHQLRDELGVRLLLLGYDNRFGKRNDMETFESYLRYGKELGVRVLLANPVDVNGVRVSSSQVRHAVAEGRMEEAAISLGRPYFVTGMVVTGHKEGRRIGFPTANILPPKGKLLPPNGVYATQVKVGERVFRGMTNVGIRPTYNEEFADEIVTIETNIFDFNEDIYGKDITVEFLHKVRDEQQFSSPEELQRQIEKDKATILKS